MAFVKRNLAVSLLIAILLLSFTRLSMAVTGVHMVGDAAGWTIGGVDYAKWASSYNFQVGDTLLFAYNKDYHNVMLVGHEDFESCNVESPIVTYNTGSDSVTLKRPGHYYYLCGVPGHCQAGQKLEVVVSDLMISSPTPTPTPAAAPSISISVPTPTPTARATPTPSSVPATNPILLSSMIGPVIILAFVY